jgi:hypothetical protein
MDTEGIIIDGDVKDDTVICLPLTSARISN